MYRPRQPKKVLPEKKPVLIVLPYCGVSSLQIRTRLASLCKKHFPQVNCRIVLRPASRLCNLFRFKDRVPIALKSKVVYSYKCSGCNAHYYSKPIRHTKTRCCEHMGISPLTGSVCADPVHTAVFDHFVSCTKTRPCMDDFSTLCSCSSDFVCKIKESILIKKDDPLLNKTVSYLPFALF